MKEKTIKCYQYDELEGKAKERARNWFLESDEMDWAWDDMKGDAADVGLKLTAIDERSGAEGDFIDSATVCADAIIREHGATCDTFKTAQAFQREHSALWAKYRDAEAKDESTLAVEDEIEELEKEFLRSLLEDYRILWTREVEYHYSEEYVKESMEANEYEFDENGRRVL